MIVIFRSSASVFANIIGHHHVFGIVNISSPFLEIKQFKSSVGLTSVVSSPFTIVSPPCRRDSSISHLRFSRRKSINSLSDICLSFNAIRNLFRPQISSQIHSATSCGIMRSVATLSLITPLNQLAGLVEGHGVT